MNRKIAVALCAVFAVAAVAHHVTSRPADSPAAARTSPEPIRLITGAGLVEPRSEEVRIGADIDGRLRSVPVQEAERVHRGQIIAIIDNDDFVARVQIARAAVSEKKAILDRMLNGSRIEQRREVEALVREAEAAFENARSEGRRLKALFDNGLIARNEFEAGEREYRMMEARLDSVRQRAALVQEESRSEDIRRAQAELERANAQFMEAEALLAKTVIRAPFDGVVLRKIKKEGEVVSTISGNVIVSLGDCARLRVRVDVDETDVGRLHLGQSAWVRADAYGERTFPGTVVQIGQAVGRKNVYTEEPSEKVDTRVLETLIELAPGMTLPVGLRVDAYINPQTTVADGSVLAPELVSRIRQTHR